jgi:hypothetical protein
VEGEASEVIPPPILFLVTICTRDALSTIDANDAPRFPRFDVHPYSPTKCKSFSVIPSPSSRTRIQEGRCSWKEEESESSHETSLASASMPFKTNRSRHSATERIVVVIFLFSLFSLSVCVSVVFSVHQSLARARACGFFVVVVVFLKARERRKKINKKAPKIIEGQAVQKRGIHRQKIKRQKKQSATQTRHTQTRKKHKTPESAKRGRYSLYPPVYKRARTHA